MKKLFKLLIVVMLVFALAGPACAEYQDMWANVYRWTGTMNGDGSMALTKITSGVTFKVLAIDSDTAETLYYYAKPAMTSLTNPVTTTSFADNAICNDKVAFKVDPTDATNDQYVDLIVTDMAGFYSAFVENFDKYTHAIVIDERPNISHVGTIWFAHATTVEQNTGAYFLPDTLVKDARVEVVETCLAGTIDVGLYSSQTAGDADGFRDGVLLTTAGFIGDTGFITAGASVDYYPDSTYGDLLYTILSGTGASWDAGGGRTFMGHVITAANASTVTYTVDSTTSGEGYIYVEHVRLR